MWLSGVLPLVCLLRDVYCLLISSVSHIDIPRCVTACRDGSTVYINYRAQFNSEAKPSRKRKAPAGGADDAELDAALEAEQAAGAPHNSLALRAWPWAAHVPERVPPA